MHWKRSIGALLIWVIVAMLVGLTGALLPRGEWYEQLQLPGWTPARWLFGLIAACVYFFLGAAAWRVWGHGGFRRRVLPLGLFFLQMALQAGWPWILLVGQNPARALAVLALVWVLLIPMMPLFRRVEGLAAKLLAPYFIWITFILVWNFEIWRLN